MISHRANIWRLHSGSSPAISHFDTGGNILSWSHRQLTGHERLWAPYGPHSLLLVPLFLHLHYYNLILPYFSSTFSCFVPLQVPYCRLSIFTVATFTIPIPSPTKQQRYALYAVRNGTQLSCFVCRNADRLGSIYKHENFHYVRLPICKQRNKGRVPYS